MENQEKLRLYKRALRDYQRIASDFNEHKSYTYNQFKDYFQPYGTDMGSVFVIERGVVKVYLIPYHKELLSSQSCDCSLSLHIVIYRIQENFKEEIDSLSLPMLKWKIMNLDNIGKFIKEMRKNKNLTQEELAEKLGVNNRTVSRWENGKNMPDISLYKPLCEVLGISIEELVNGELTNKKNISYSVEKAIINTVSSSKKEKSKMSKIIKFLSVLVIVTTIFVVFVVVYYKKKYPRIDIYNLDIIKSEESKLNEELTLNMLDYKIWFYGIESLEINDVNNNYFDLKTALKYNQISIQDVVNFLEKEYDSERILMYELRDGGTKIYKSNKYEIILCNTIEGNHDIYFGVPDTSKRLNNAYCGKEANNTCYFTRTYHVKSVVQTTDSDFVDITLEDNTVVKVNSSFGLTASKDYEFVFSTYNKFKDTTTNIFENSTIMEVKETNHIINQEICVN